MSLLISEMHIETTLEHHYHLSEWLSPINQQQVLVRMWTKENPHAPFVGMLIGAATMGKSMEVSHKY